jgi:hypothetical protein
MLEAKQALRSAFWARKPRFVQVSKPIARAKQDSNPFTIKAAFNDEKA